MTVFNVDWVDAFTTSAFGGNGCAVVHAAAHLETDTCLKFVRETSLVECTFTGPSDVADLQVKYFLASHEIPFAGHPTIATVAALIHQGLVTGTSLTLETRAGIIPVEIDRTVTPPRITMTQIAPVFGQQPDPNLVAAAISLPVEAIIHPPQIVSTGLGFCVTVLRDHTALQAAHLDLKALQDLADALGHGNIAMEEPFLVTLDGASPKGDTFSRLLLAPPSPPEDPFTGSATGAMASYLWHHGLMPKDVFVAEQGHDMGRPGQAVVERLGPAASPTGIRVSGQAHVLMSGQLYL